MKLEVVPNGIRLCCKSTFSSGLLPVDPQLLDVVLSTQTAKLQWANKRHLNFAVKDIQDVRIFFRGSTPDDDTEQKTGIILELSSPHPASIYLNRGYLTQQDATDIAIALRQHLGLPPKPDYSQNGFSSPHFEPDSIQILAKTSQHLVCRHNLMKGALIAAAIILAFLSTITLIPILAFPSPTPQILIGIMLFVALLIVQSTGLNEVWSFNRVTGQCQVTRTFLLGKKKVQKFGRQDVSGINILTLIPIDAAQEIYEVEVLIPNLAVKNSLRHAEIRHQTTNLQAAEEFAEMMRYYLWMD
jgi:hypothetical protein